MKIDICELSEIHDISLNMSEEVTENYRVDSGQLVRFRFEFSIPDWSKEKRTKWVSALNLLAREGGTIVQASCGAQSVGIASLSPKWFGEKRLQLYSLHVDRHHRRLGVGQLLFEYIEEKSRQSGATRLYISAAPKKGTVDFYKRMGAQLADEIDPDLYKLEPNDIHLEKMLKKY